MDRRDVLRGIGGAMAVPMVSAWPAAAQSKYPDRPIRLVVPYPPGGVVDAVARQWGDKIRPSLGAVVIENLAGGGGTIASAAVARAQPDGYSLLFGDSSSQII